MIKNNVKIPALIALGTQGAYVFVSLIIVFVQDKLEGIFGYPRVLKGIKVFPPIVAIGIVNLILYIIFAYTIFNYGGEKRRVISIVFFSISVALSVLYYPITVLIQYICGAVMSSEYLAAMSLLTSGITMFTFLFSAAAAPFYYIAVGRYGLSKKED